MPVGASGFAWTGGRVGRVDVVVRVDNIVIGLRVLAVGLVGKVVVAVGVGVDGNAKVFVGGGMMLRARGVDEVNTSPGGRLAWC